MIAVIAGATGLVGSLVLQRLIENPQFSKVISISRRSTGLQSSKLKEILISDLSEIQSRAKDLQGDAYFCCLGTTIKDAGSQAQFEKVDFLAVVDFAKVAKSHQAKSFQIVSAAGANSRSLVFYNRVKGKAEEALRDLGFQKLVIFQPGLLMGERKAFRRGEKIMISVFRKLDVVIPEKLGRNIMTETDILADHMIHSSLESGSGTFVISPREIRRF